jgi:hypothetical protein
VRGERQADGNIGRAPWLDGGGKDDHMGQFRLARNVAKPD